MPFFENTATIGKSALLEPVEKVSAEFQWPRNYALVSSFPNFTMHTNPPRVLFKMRILIQQV